MSVPFLLGTDCLRKIQSVRPESLVSLWPQNEYLGGVSTEIVRQYNGAYTGVTLGQPGIPGTGMTSPFFDGANDFNNIYSAGLANDNLLLNPGFETPGGGGADIWAEWNETAGDGALANEGVIVHEGNDACKVTAGATANTYLYDQYVVVPETKYRLRFWTYGDGVNAGRYGIYDATNAAYIQATTTTGVTAAAWTMVAQEFTTPAGCIALQLIFNCSTVNTTVTYFDACEIRRKDGFLGDQGTIIVPAQVANAGVWGDGIGRRLIYIGVDANNYIAISRIAAAGSIEFNYKAGGVAESQITGGLANLDFAKYSITWDRSAGATGEVMYYIDGVASGATDVGLGTWLGDLAAANTVIGAESTVPAFVWSGNEGSVPMWSEALSPDEMRYLG